MHNLKEGITKFLCSYLGYRGLNCTALYFVYYMYILKHKRVKEYLKVVLTI